MHSGGVGSFSTMALMWLCTVVPPALALCVWPWLKPEGLTRNSECPREHRKRSMDVHCWVRSPSLQMPIPCLAAWSRGPKFHTAPVWELCSFSGLGPQPWLSQPCRWCCRQAVLLARLKIARS